MNLIYILCHDLFKYYCSTMKSRCSLVSWPICKIRFLKNIYNDGNVEARYLLYEMKHDNISFTVVFASCFYGEYFRVISIYFRLFFQCHTVQLTTHNFVHFTGTQLWPKSNSQIFNFRPVINKMNKINIITLMTRSMYPLVWSDDTGV